jgi:hypothetical protein
MTLTDHIFRWSWYLFIAVFITAFFVTAFWLFYPYRPIVVHYIKVLNPGKTVMAGDFLTYEISYDKKMDVVGVLSRKIENTYVYDLRDSVASNPIGPGVDRVQIPIPEFAETSDDYHLRWVVRYPVNPLRWVTVMAIGETFSVKRDHSERGEQGPKGDDGRVGKQGVKGDKGDKGGFSLFGGKK